MIIMSIEENIKYFISNNRTLIIVIVCVLVVILSLTSVATAVIVTENSKSTDIVIEGLDYVYSGPQVFGSNVLTEEEFKALDDNTSFGTYDDYLASANSSFESSGYSVTATGANLDLYNYCDDYFNCYYGYDRISPIFPMALANVETPGRADNSITWSSLFPSRYVDVSLMGTFNVVDVISDESIFNALSSEYSTRDRGALQMSPTYGTGNSVLNNQMSGNEKDKLKSSGDTSHSSWASGASSYPGDRFYLPDVLLRLQSAMQSNISNMLKNGYVPETDMQMIAMLAIAHNTGSGIWSNPNHDKSVGNWHSSQKAFDLCRNIGSANLISEVTDFAISNDSTYINTEEAITLYNNVFSDSISNYTTSKVNGTFAIKALYSYVKLSMLYTE